MRAFWVVGVVVAGLGVASPAVAMIGMSEGARGFVERGVEIDEERRWGWSPSAEQHRRAMELRRIEEERRFRDMELDNRLRRLESRTRCLEDASRGFGNPRLC